MTLKKDMYEIWISRQRTAEGVVGSVYERYLNKLAEVRKNPSKEVRTRGLLDIITPKIK